MKTWEKAHAVFAEYAGMDAPSLPVNGLSALQVRLYRWQVKNFGTTMPQLLALGIAEEIGELYEADSKADRFDAVGDALVFACQLATANRLDFGSLLVDIPDPYPTRRELPTVVGKICHVALKSSQSIRGYNDPAVAREAMAYRIMLLFSELQYFVGSQFDPLEAFCQTAEDVMRRDWTTNAETGGAP